ncbi:hypothetical protein C4B60_00035 [Jeotgalibacillus proteolyticus]|uniref:Uncharacterized protein n=1 Tax=Jeotgalibacillus proteolyticus TaxID=2082395 RepID=A0A2S5GFV6_9BACL|nr:hypothetical protein C4B60_00035 [Jeotgalibacillus proteolyticus]
MAQEVLDKKHGNGHNNRIKSLGISAEEYQKVRAEVNRRSGVSIPVASSRQKPQAGEGIVDYMNRMKLDSSYNNRARLAAQHGIYNYSGTASQNSLLLTKISR